MRHVKSFSIVLLLALLVAPGFSVFAQEQVAPKARNYVNDFAGILPDNVEATLNTLLSRLDEKTTAEVAVVTIAGLEGEALEPYAVRLFEQYGIGKRGKDNGVLLLIAMKERKVRIEVGYGLEGALPDGLCGEIIRNSIVPYFKKGDYASGVVSGTLSIAQIVAKEYNYDLASDIKSLSASMPMTRRAKKRSALGNLLYLIIVILFLCGRFWLFPFFFGMGGGYWSGGGGGGGFGGGFGGFGGGMSGGGGASGGW